MPGAIALAPFLYNQSAFAQRRRGGGIRRFNLLHGGRHHNAITACGQRYP